MTEYNEFGEALSSEAATANAKTATVSLSKTEPKRSIYDLPIARWAHAELNFVSSPAEHDRECEGHESLRGDAMGAAVYCDGSCRPAWSPLIRV